jgi:hypothetical protein
MGSRLGFDALGSPESIKKAGGPIWPTARGSWLGAVLPPGNYLEKGTDLPRSAAPTGAIVGRKRSIWLICSPSSVEVVDWHGIRAGRGV